jgi:hypothetical protein
MLQLGLNQGTFFVDRGPDYPGIKISRLFFHFNEAVFNGKGGQLGNVV